METNPREGYIYIPSRMNNEVTLYTDCLHPAGRALTPVSSVNSFIMILYEKMFLVMYWTELPFKRQVSIPVGYQLSAF